MADGLPLVVLVDPEPFPPLGFALHGIARVEHRFEHRFDPREVLQVLLLAAGEGAAATLGAMARGPSSSRASVLVYVKQPTVDPDERTAWLARGADDVTTRQKLVEGVMRWLPGSPRSPSSTGSSPIVPSKAQEPIPAILSPPIPDVEPCAAFIRALDHYCRLRGRIVGRLGPAGNQEMASLFFHRARVAEHLRGPSSSDPAVLRIRDCRVTQSWPVDLVCSGERSQAVIVDISADGACLQLSSPPEAARRLRVQLEVAGTLRAELEFEPRWKRRVSSQVWHLGVSVTGVRVEEIGA